MKQLFARQFVEDLEFLVIQRNTLFADPALLAAKFHLDQLIKLLGRVRTASLALAFRDAVREIDHFTRKASLSKITNQQVTSDIDAIRRRLKDSLLTGAFVFLPHDKARWHQALVPDAHVATIWPDNADWQPTPIPVQLHQAFPAAISDLQAARNCFATDNHTACVFHLMRAVEHGLRALALAAGVGSTKIPLEFQMWQQLITQIESQIKNAHIEKWTQPSKGNALAFFGAVIADFYAFKDDIRNVLMHTRTIEDYSEAQALHLIERIENCLLRLAGKVQEGSTTPILIESTFSA